MRGSACCSTRSKYVHGDLLKEQEESERLAELRELRMIVRQVVLRWRILTPYDTEDLAPRLDAAADCNRCKRAIDEPLCPSLRKRLRRTKFGAETERSLGPAMRVIGPATWTTKAQAIFCGSVVSWAILGRTSWFPL